MEYHALFKPKFKQTILLNRLPATRGRQQRAPRAVPVAAAAAAANGAAVRGPRDLELVPLHRRLCLDDSCNCKDRVAGL